LTDNPEKPRRRWWKYLLVLFLLAVLATVSVIWYATTDSFQAMVRRRLVAELETMSGGKVEIGSFHTTPFRLRIDIRNLTIHGREGPGEVPYAHVDRIVADVKIISLIGTEFGFHSILLDHPVVHIIVYPDGTTNQPPLRARDTSAKSPVDPLFSLAIGRFDVQNGQLIWDNQSIPLDFTATDISAGMSYSRFRRRFESYVILGKVDTKLRDFRPFSWRAEAQFGLASKSVDVSSLKWSSGTSQLQAKGRLNDFHQPKIEGSFRGTIDLAELDTIVRRREVRAGLLDIQGNGSWSLDHFLSEGKLLARGLDWRTPNLALHNASLASDFWLTDRQLRLTKMDGHLLGGSAVGDLEVTNWRDSLQAQPARISTKKALPEQKGLLRLRLKGLSLPAVDAALSTPARPLSLANLAGTVEGSVDGGWRGPLNNLEAQVALDVNPPTHSSPPELPVTAVVRATYRSASEELELSQFSASTAASQLRASGILSSTSSLKVFATTTNLHEWQPVITALNGPPELAFSLHGRATFNGVATGKLSSLSFMGNLEVKDFNSLIPAPAQIPGKAIHWDSFTANVQFSPDRLSIHNGTLRHAGTDVRFDLSAGLKQRQFLDTSPFTASLNIHSGDVTEIQSLGGYKYPVTGRMNLTLRVSGTRFDPHGEGHLQLTDAVVYGEPLSRLDSDLRFINGEAQLNNLQAIQNSAQIAGSAGYNLSSKNFHFNLTGNNFNLSHFPQLQTGRFSVDGRMDLTAQGSGTLDQPIINAKLQLHDLAFDKERAGDFTIDAVTQGADLRVSGVSHFATSELTVDGAVRLREPWPADLNLHFRHLDVDSLIRVYFRGRVTGHSAVAGDMRLKGPLFQPRQWNLTANLKEFLIDVQNVKLINDGPIHFSTDNGTLNLEQLHLVGDLTDFSAHGKAQLTGERQLDFRADGHINLKTIETFNPAFTSSGIVTLGLSVSGTIQDPLLQGRVEVADGAISYIELPSGLSNMNGTLTFNQDRLQIETLTARTGGGSLNLGGSITYLHHTPSFDLTIQGQDVRLRYPPGVSSTANADLRLIGSTSAATLSGDITVTKLAVTPGFDFASYLERSKQSTVVPTADSLLNRLKLDVHVTTTPELQMQTALAKLTGDADLHARGTAAKPVLLGRVDILEGEINFNGAKYRLERGDVTFNNPVRIDPILDLQATTHVSDYDITIGLNGTLDKLSVNYRSEPPLPSADIIALLAMGRTREESVALQGGPSPYSAEASNLILTQALNAAASNRAQRLFGVSRIKIDPEGLGTETSINKGPQVTIQQQVYNNLTLTYSTNVAQTSQQIIQLEYSITRNLSIVALRDYNGVVSFDVKLRRRRK
jgi:translocation and assembly module TamB